MGLCVFTRKVSVEVHLLHGQTIFFRANRNTTKNIYFTKLIFYITREAEEKLFSTIQLQMNLAIAIVFILSLNQKRPNLK